MPNTNHTITKELVTSNVKVPGEVWDRAKLALARLSIATGERLNMQKLLAQGLEIRIEQIEKKLAKKESAA